MSPTRLASAARVLCRLMERNAVDPATVFRDVGLDPAGMHDPRARYPDDQMCAAWAEASRRITNPCFGLQAAAAWLPTDFHALGYAFIASRTLLAGIERLVRYSAVVDPNIDIEQSLDGDQLRLAYRVQNLGMPEPPALQDARWAVVLGLCRAAHGPDLAPVQISLTHPAPACRGEYFGLFRCPVRFGSPVSELILERAQAEAPLPAGNRELALAIEAIRRRYLAELEVSDVVSRVKTAIVDHLPSGAPSAETIATDMAMSARSLQRRLADAGTSFSEVLESVRRELAAAYIADPSRSLAEISFLLGFSEQSAFSRAFRRWSGRSPSDARASVT